MDDSALNHLITGLPPKSIALIEDIDVAFTRGPAPDTRRSEPNATPQFHHGFGNVHMGFGSSYGDLTLAGLLGAVDGVAAQEGRILFATTNQYHVIDAALKRPGRLDIHVEFKEASKKQAEELFKRFYTADDGGVGNVEKPLIELGGTEHLKDNGCTPSEKAPLESIPSSVDLISAASPKAAATFKLTEAQLSEMASRFSSALPERKFTMAAIQGHLMRYKTDPYRAIEEVAAFVKRERVQKEAEEKLHATVEHSDDHDEPDQAERLADRKE